MGLALTQVITEDRASGGQIIDGSLRFDDGSKNYLTRTPGSSGNRDTWTYSLWIKRGALTSAMRLLDAGTSDTEKTAISLLSNSGLEDQVQFYHITGGADYGWNSTLKLRDNSAWYHLVFVYNSPSGTGSERMRGYVNGVEISSFATDYGTLPQNQDSFVNHTNAHNIGKHVSNDSTYYDGYMSQVYLVDGQQLAPSEFGFTDPLTNTWRPKKYTGTYGTNGFYLPLDGNSLIGEDKSGNGNDFTPVNFGGSNSIEKATGALPILNTVNGGTTATVGVRTDSDSSGLGLALPLVGTVNDVSNQVNNGSTTKTITKGNNVDADSDRYNFYGGSHRFNGSTDYLDVAASSDFAFGTGDFTVECWIYSGVNSLDGFYRRIYMTDGPTGNATGNFQIAITPTSGVINLWETSGQLDVNGTTDVTDQKWNHIAAVRSGTTLKLYVNGVEELSTTYSTSVTANSGSPRPRIGNYNGSSGEGDFDGYMQDLRVYKGVAKYTSNFIPASTNPDILPDTPSGVAGGSALTKITDGSVSFDNSGDSLTTPDHADFDLGTNSFTIEAFIYLQTLGQFNNIFAIGTDASNGYRLDVTTGNDLRFLSHIGGTWTDQGLLTDDALVANRWYHVAVTRNGNDFDLWVDGQRGCSTVTSSSSITNPDTQLEIGRLTTNSLDRNYHGFISNLRFVNGSAVYTSPFTPSTSALTNVTNTKLLCCQTYTDRTAAAVSPGTITGNGNAQANTFNPFTTDIDAVRGQESGYATLNPVSFRGNGSITDGNLTMAANSSGDCCAAVTLQIPTGKKIYLEAQHNITAGAGNRAQIGVVNVNVDTGAMSRPGDQAGGWAYDFSTNSGNSGAWDEGTRTAGPTTDNGDICMWCIDLSAGLMWAGKNGQWFSTGNPSTGSGAVITGIPDTATGLKVSVDGGASNRSELIYNFGQKPFKYNPPDGFQPLCLANLSRPTNLAAVRPEAYVGVHTYVGTGSEHDIPNAFGFNPDFLWTRRSDATGDRHNWYDKVRGDDGTRMYVICPDATTSQATRTEATTAMVRSSQWPRHGFRVGTNGQTNSSGAVYTAFGLKAGGAPVSNSDGSITTQVSASPESGFSIIGYTGNTTTGASIGHGLNQAPEMLIFKSLSEDRGWLIWHKDLNAGAGDYTLSFNALKRSLDSRTDRPLKDSGCTTATTIILGLDSEVNHNNEMICYAFHSVPGVVKVGRYNGNGATTDGPFVDCGFRPKFVIAKNYAGGSETNWFVKDAENAKFNPAQFTFYLNNSDARVNNFPIDFYSNGFKLRDDNALINESGSNYIYIAWADTPTQTLYGGQANAR